MVSSESAVQLSFAQWIARITSPSRRNEFFSQAQGRTVLRRWIPLNTIEYHGMLLNIRYFSLIVNYSIYLIAKWKLNTHCFTFIYWIPKWSPNCQIAFASTSWSRNHCTHPALLRPIDPLQQQRALALLLRILRSKPYRASRWIQWLDHRQNDARWRPRHHSKILRPSENGLTPPEENLPFLVEGQNARIQLPGSWFAYEH